MPRDLVDLRDTFTNEDPDVGKDRCTCVFPLSLHLSIIVKSLSFDKDPRMDVLVFARVQLFLQLFSIRR